MKTLCPPMGQDNNNVSWGSVEKHETKDQRPVSPPSEWAVMDAVPDHEEGKG